MGLKIHIYSHLQADKTNLNQRNPNQVCPQPKSLNQPPQATDMCTSILNRSWIIRYSTELQRRIKYMTSLNTVMLKTCQNHGGEPLDLSCSVLMASHNYSWYYYLRSWPAICIKKDICCHKQELLYLGSQGSSSRNYGKYFMMEEKSSVPLRVFHFILYQLPWHVSDIFFYRYTSINFNGKILQDVIDDKKSNFSRRFKFDPITTYDI